MMGMDPKKMASMIIISKKPTGEGMKKANQEGLSKMVEAEKEGAEDTESVGLKAAAEEIIKAIKDSDASALGEALKSFVQMCDYEEDGEA